MDSPKLGAGRRCTSRISSVVLLSGLYVYIGGVMMVSIISTGRKDDCDV